MLESCLEQVIEIQIDQDSESGKREFKAKEWDLWDVKTICTERRWALSLIESRLAQRTRISVEDWARS